MTEYWVSQAKFYCKYCNFYVTDNKTARAKHDSSERHKNCIQLYHKKKREKNLHGASSELDLQNTLAAIEKAAYAALAQDKLGAPTASQGQRKESSSSQQARGLDGPKNYSSSGNNTNHSSSSGGAGRHSNSNNFSMVSSKPFLPPPAGPVKLSEKALELISENLRDEKGESGVYTVRGVTYLEGQYHEDRLLSGTKCEIFVEGADDWCPGEVIRSLHHAIPHTDIVQRTYDVKYIIQDDDQHAPNGASSGTPRDVEEFGIKSDRIRLIQQKSAAEVYETSTGLGRWQTVSVRIINEEEEAERLRQQEIAEQEELEQQKQEQKKINENVLLEAGEVEDSLSSFDPYNTGIYRGIDISGRNATASQELESLTDGKEVQFKKRKEGGEAQKKVRNIRRKGNSD